VNKANAVDLSAGQMRPGLTRYVLARRNEVVLFLVGRSMEFTLNLASSKKRAKIRMVFFVFDSLLRTSHKQSVAYFPAPEVISGETFVFGNRESCSSRRLLQQKKYPAAQGLGSIVSLVIR